MKVLLLIVLCAVACQANVLSLAKPAATVEASCLNATQQKQLKEAATSIKAILFTATTTLRIAAIAEKNATIKKDLEEAATVTSAVNQELVSQLVKIANEACGTCEQIVQAVNDGIDAIENTLAKIDPDWKNNPIFKAVVAAVQAIVDLVKAICPSNKLQLLAPVEAKLIKLSPLDNCLNATQEKALKTATTTIKGVLFAAVTALRIAEFAEKNATIKKDLEEAATVVSAVNQKLVSQLAKIANEACGTCSQIVQAVNDGIDAIEDTLAKIDPDWKNNPIFKAVVAAVQAIVDLVKAICPSTEAVLQKL